jgi:uncharacterized membrane protein
MNLYVVIAVGLTILALDAVWLTFRAGYHTGLFKSVQGSPLVIRIVPAALVYVLIPVAIVYLVLDHVKTIQEAGIKGAALGAAMYGLYDLTNYATLTKWTLEMTITDILWGTIVCGAGSMAGHLMSKRV